MRPMRLRILFTVILMALAGCATPPVPPPTATPIATPISATIPPATPTSQPTQTAVIPTPLPAEPTPLPVDPFPLISQDSLFATLEDLTAIQPYSGWRNSATEGEQEALDYVEQRLGDMEYLEGLGLELERQSCRVFNSTELWETRLHLTVHGQEVEVPADGIRGQRDDTSLALRFDSDGALNDGARNPVVAEGPVVLARSVDEILAEQADLEGRVVFLDYASIAEVLVGRQQAVWTANNLLSLEPAGVVLVTRFSNQPGESHGAFVGDYNPFIWLGVGPESPAVPILYARLEDLAVAGIKDWDDLSQIEAARLTWDADVFAPGTSGNLVARIPGTDDSRAVILGAHIDSPNCPGAMDDGSGSAVLLEIARVLDAAQIQPPVDLVLVWFGSEELGHYGSAHFCATHQELLDRTLAMLQIDTLTHPLDGIDADLTLSTWSYGRLGDERLTWPDYLTEIAERRDVRTVPVNSYKLQSDNIVFVGFDVPNANLIYMGPEMEDLGPIHYAAHLHDPYDTVELAREVGDVLEQMARVALAAALETGWDDPELRVSPRPDQRAVFVGTHTEALLMTPGGFADLGQTLAMEGLDVDLIPYGHAPAAVDLKDAALVVVLPVIDLPVQGESGLYDDAWSEEEIATLEAYVANGGLLVLTSSAHRLKLYNRMYDYNEDWRDVNALARRFGVSYEFETLPYRLILVEKGSHPLVEGITYLEVMEKNGASLTMSEGLVLAQEDGKVMAGLVDYGDAGGQVLALADVGMLGNASNTASRNLTFWQNLARYARSR